MDFIDHFDTQKINAYEQRLKKIYYLSKVKKTRFYDFIHSRVIQIFYIAICKILKLNFKQTFIEKKSLIL